MEKASGISGKFGSSGGNVSYSHSHIKPKPPLKFRAGEIVKGVIISIHEAGFAEVRLPNGTFTAEIKGRLKAGDSLFFLVKAVNPGLVLTIHSVSYSISGKDLELKDIIRVLDLPESQASNEIVEYLKTKNSTILRQDCINIYSVLTKLDKNAFKYRRLREYILAAYYILNSGFDESPGSVGALAPLFTDLFELKKNMNELRKHESVDSFLKNIFNRENKLNKATLFCSDNRIENTNNLAALLKKLPAKDTYDVGLTIKAQRFWNETGFSTGQNLILIYPLVSGPNAIYCRLEIFKSPSDAGYSDNFETKLHKTLNKIDSAFNTIEEFNYNSDTTIINIEEQLRYLAKELNIVLLRDKMALIGFYAKLTASGNETDYFVPDRPINAMRLSVVV